MKQTAVEWIMSQLPEILGDHILSNLDMEQTNRIHFLEKQAKAMEKQQAMEFLEEYDSYVFRGGSMSVEQYYNETYGTVI
jgi:hypothetical protein